MVISLKKIYVKQYIISRVALELFIVKITSRVY